ncbi:MAG: response regulator [Bacteroidetes bacterium]|nr:response regulator [Bacteroidota bacterium]
MNLSTHIVKHPSIFILDDDKFYLEYMKEIIYSYSSSINTHTFLNKNEMMSHLKHKPDVIILDYNLGMENSKKITAHAVITDIENLNPDQYIVLISGEDTAPLLEEYNRYRNLDFLVKSPDVNQDIISLLNKRLNMIH